MRVVAVLVAVAAVMFYPLPAHAACGEVGVFSYTAKTSPGYAYPVNGEEGVLNTTWSHKFDSSCYWQNSGETVGIHFIWTSGNDWFEIGDQKYPGYLADGFGFVFEEWGIYPETTQLAQAGDDPIASRSIALKVLKTGDSSNNTWTVYYDRSGTYNSFVAEAVVGGFTSDRGAGWAESSRYGSNSTGYSSQSALNYRCPCDGRWYARSIHTTCADNDPVFDTLSVSTYHDFKVGAPATNTNRCYP
ncbi:MAG: hypothetical protein ABR548_11240 [Actinomycetota bacterium]|nr:hypothetical protein [Actinomycetota bacterium]